MRDGETQPDNKEMVTRETAARRAIDFWEEHGKADQLRRMRPKHQPA